MVLCVFYDRLLLAPKFKVRSFFWVYNHTCSSTRLNVSRISDFSRIQTIDSSVSITSLKTFLKADFYGSLHFIIRLLISLRHKIPRLQSKRDSKTSHTWFKRSRQYSLSMKTLTGQISAERHVLFFTTANLKFCSRFPLFSTDKSLFSEFYANFQVYFFHHFTPTPYRQNSCICYLN